jgi:hypothetical protein
MKEDTKEKMAVFLGALIAIALLANMLLGVYILTVAVTGGLL